MKRHLVALTTDIMVDLPKGIGTDPESPEVQKFLREEFIDFLQSAEHIRLGFDIQEEEEE